MIQFIKQLKLSVVAMALVGTVCAQNTIVNDANAELRTINGSFTTIKISGGIDVYLTQGGENAVAVSASSEKQKSNIRTEVKDGILSISYDDNLDFKSKYMRAYVSFKTLEKLSISGACDVQVNGVINVPSLDIVLAGASDFKGEIKVAGLQLNVSGASDARLSGTVTDATIMASGASDVKCFDLQADNCNVKASGASDISITVNKELSVNATGASDIRYKGNCVIKEMHSSGASGIGKRG